MRSFEVCPIRVESSVSSISGSRGINRDKECEIPVAQELRCLTVAHWLRNDLVTYSEISMLDTRGRATRKPVCDFSGMMDATKIDHCLHRVDHVHSMHCCYRKMWEERRKW